MEAIARKEISRKEKNNIEHIKNSIIHFEFNDGIITSIKIMFDEYEYAQENGIYENQDDEIVYIDVNLLLEALNERIECADYDENVSTEKIIIEYLEKYKGYKIDLL
jgi:hypothetical protein